MEVLSDCTKIQVYTRAVQGTQTNCASGRHDQSADVSTRAQYLFLFSNYFWSDKSHTGLFFMAAPALCTANSGGAGVLHVRCFCTCARTAEFSLTPSEDGSLFLVTSPILYVIIARHTLAGLFPLNSPRVAELYSVGVRATEAVKGIGGTIGVTQRPLRGSAKQTSRGGLFSRRSVRPSLSPRRAPCLTVARAPPGRRAPTRPPPQPQLPPRPSRESSKSR